MAVPGVLMRLVEPRDPNSPTQGAGSGAPSWLNDKATAIYNLTILEGPGPSLNTVYILDDVTPLLTTSSHYTKDCSDNKDHFTSVSWVICSFINGRDMNPGPSTTTTTTTPTNPHQLPNPPNPSSVIVINGSTPRPDKEQDYHDWYDQEHGGKLGLVPGWNSSRRYKLEKSYGEAETASFYGFNYYEEKNGLGGSEWQASQTEWAARIKGNAAKPNVRRVWRVVAAA